ncbi:hypothetical protein DIPPA_29028 [Diplonema papillatum]|nr:hypothetical protein DIPPA_29028 [Diplonema papillatum]
MGQNASVIQRVANKAYTDPKMWAKLNEHNMKDVVYMRSLTPHNPMQGEKNAVNELMNASSRIDADEYYDAMNKIEEEHTANSKLNPDEVTNTLRMQLYQQRQYLSYKDTMLRMGVPESSVLSIEKWADNHEKPMEANEQDVWHSMSDRVHALECVSNMLKDPSEHDTFSAIEDGDNRISERMLTHLMILKQEGKLDCDAAGRELHRDPEIIRRVTEHIRTVPPSINFSPSTDVETAYHISLTGNKDVQRASFIKNLKGLFRGSTRAGNYELAGHIPENIPARGFRPPKRAAKGKQDEPFMQQPTDPRTSAF